MSHYFTETSSRVQPGHRGLEATIIDLRRRRQRRGRAALADGALIGYFHHQDATLRISASGVSALRVEGHPGCPRLDIEGCAELVWSPVGTVTHRHITPTFSWRYGVTPWLSDTDVIACKAAAAHYHVLKGHMLDLNDHILVNPEPVWLDE